ncbi:hypothetical protein F5B19DRAFT_494531 [Rostrohypoxylon terebratum]|nr:hypothetical protein F5B19DRAFT_494531 [Rostrohypoxylon terebratum]
MGLSKVAIIAAPTKEPRAVAQQSFGVATVFAPTFVTILQCQRILDTTFLSLYGRAHWIVSAILGVCYIMASQAYIASSCCQHCASTVSKALWRTRIVQSLGKKVAFEFFTLFLGSGGNAVCLLLFWPGWWVIGLIGWAAHHLYVS